MTNFTQEYIYSEYKPTIAEIKLEIAAAEKLIAAASYEMLQAAYRLKIADSTLNSHITAADITAADTELFSATSDLELKCEDTAFELQKLLQA